VDNATLTRFFTLHFLIPFMMVGLTLIHLALLHVDGSTNPLGIEDNYDTIPFYPYFLIKDTFGFLIFLFIFSYLVFFEPNLLGHPDNYTRANPLITPPHIVPEWYFLPFYAILRAVPSKLGGVIAMGSAIVILFFLPVIDRGQFFLLAGLRPGAIWVCKGLVKLFMEPYIFVAKHHTEGGNWAEEPEEAPLPLVNCSDLPVVYKGPRFRPLFKLFFSF
jgi:ubiquinol-cytochrome c reductase cytochrome b/c1 subunit